MYFSIGAKSERTLNEVKTKQSTHYKCFTKRVILLYIRQNSIVFFFIYIVEIHHIKLKLTSDITFKSLIFLEIFSAQILHFTDKIRSVVSAKKITNLNKHKNILCSSFMISGLPKEFNCTWKKNTVYCTKY